MPESWLQPAIGALAGQFSGNPFPSTPGFARAAGVQAPAAPRSAPITTTTQRTPGLTPPRNAVSKMNQGFGNYGTRDAFQSWQGTGSGEFGMREAFDNGFDNQSAMQQAQQAYNGMQGAAAGDSGFAMLDQHNAEINNAASKYGVPANLIKSMINRESSGDWDRDNRVYYGLRGQGMLPFVGIFQSTADSWGLDFDSMIGNKQAQIDGMAKILSGLATQYGGYENAAKVYFGGEQALNGGFTDEYGMNSADYGQKAVDLWKQLDQKSGYSGGYDLPTKKWGQSGYEGNGWLQEAISFVGTPYNWGSIPGANQDPRAVGWDCSGMTYWMNQKYGDKSLPMGSHWQYKFAQDTGRLFQNTGQVQAGDLVFIDTGFRGGSGAEMNNASHVGIYLGNGKMLHAANPQQGTIISDLSAYGGVLGFMHQQGMSGGGGFGGGNSMFPQLANNPYRHGF